MSSMQKADLNKEFLLWAERVEKEQKYHKVCRNFRVHRDNLDCFPDKINVRQPKWSELPVPEDRKDPPENSVASFLPKLRERGPKERHFLPQTAAQDIGWALSLAKATPNSGSSSVAAPEPPVWPSAIPPSDSPVITNRRIRKGPGAAEAEAALNRANSLPPNPLRPKIPPALERTKLSAPAGCLGPYMQRTATTGKLTRQKSASASQPQELRSTWRHQTQEEKNRDFGKELEETRNRLHQRYRLIDERYVGRNQPMYHGLSTSDVSSFATSFVLAFGMNPFSKLAERG